MKPFRKTKWITWIIPIIFLWACGGGSGGGTSQSGGDGMGTLSLKLVDAPGDYRAVYVTIQEVQVCVATDLCEDEDEAEACDCRWETVATLNRTYNLLELVNGVMAGLGQKDLEAGTYNQMRLLLGRDPDDSLNLLDEPHPYPQYLIDDGDVERELKVPSGYQTGIKLVHPFEIVAGLTTELILDFDAARSVVKAGNSGMYILKPTIKVIGTHNRAIVSGLVTDADTALPLGGAVVTAWHQDAEDNWVVAMSTVTDTTDGHVGEYELYLDLGDPYGLAPKDYKIVATASGYAPVCTIQPVPVDQIYPEVDFALPPAEMVTVSGVITGSAAQIETGGYPSEAPTVSVGFQWQGDGCFADPVEIAAVMVTDDGDSDTTDIFYEIDDGSFRYSYSIALPAGIYTVTAEGAGLDTQVVPDFAVAASNPIDLDIAF